MPLYLFVTKKFLEFLEDPKAHNSRGIWLVVAICTLMIISLLLRYYFTFSINAYGLVIRKALTGFIFRKVVKLSQSSLAKATAGKLVNLASGDMNVIHNGIISLPNLILAPLASLANIFFIYLIVRFLTFLDRKFYLLHSHYHNSTPLSPNPYQSLLRQHTPSNC